MEIIEMKFIERAYARARKYLISRVRKMLVKMRAVIDCRSVRVAEAAEPMSYVPFSFDSLAVVSEMSSSDSIEIACHVPRAQVDS